MVQGCKGVLALSTRSWLLYNYQGRYYQAPLSYDTLEYASNFTSALCPEGIVSIAGSNLRIVTVENLGAMFNQAFHPLRYTPRKMCKVPGSNNLVIIETDHNEYTEAEKEEIETSMKQANGGSMEVEPVAKEVKGTGEDEDEDEDEEVPVLIRGPLPPTEGHWASCIRIMDPTSGNTLELLELSENEAAFSVCTCCFSNRPEETFIIVGTAKDMTLHPRRMSAGFIHVYRLLGDRLQLLHKTQLEEAPLAMTQFHGKLLVGVGRSIRLFELGKKKLLRKCENKNFPSGIVKLMTNGDRIYCGDATESIHFVKFHPQDNTLVIFADDYTPRFVSASCILDYDTVGGADKFGNVWVLQLPHKANDDVENAAGSRMLWDQGLLNGAPNKADTLTHYFLGEAPTAMFKCRLVPGGREVMLVATVMGGIYAFLPFSAKEDIDFYQHLEMYMRQEWPSLVQRDHLSYRSYFMPVKNTVDGDLCERYSSMPPSKQKELAEDLNRTPTEMMKKLEDTRNSLL
jgi:splicing factor 3B subunit 3